MTGSMQQTEPNKQNAAVLPTLYRIHIGMDISAMRSAVHPSVKITRFEGEATSPTTICTVVYHAPELAQQNGVRVGDTLTFTRESPQELRWRSRQWHILYTQDDGLVLR